ncbi:MAG: hypothetical protein ACR2NN_13410 [Bryobacteraceae bacterium]
MVTISIQPAQLERTHLDVAFIERAKRELTSDYIPTLDEVREMLSKDKSSWADLVHAERDERF